MTTAATRWLLPCRLDEFHLALPLEAVERVLPMAALLPLPGAPEIVLGLLDLAGDLLPAADPRPRFGLPPREAMASQQLVVLRTSRRRLVMRVDATGEVFPREGVREGGAIWPELPHLSGVVRLDDRWLLLADPERFFLPEEEALLDERMADAGSVAPPA